MELFEAIKKRHSYRGGFTDKGVPRKDLQKIVQAGLEAPSGKNCQTTRFVIVDEPSLLEQIGQMHPGNKAVQQAKAFIACMSITCSVKIIHTAINLRAPKSGSSIGAVLKGRILEDITGVGGTVAYTPWFFAVRIVGVI